MPTRRPRSGKLPIPYVFCDDAEHLLGKVGEASNLVRYTMMRDAVFMLRDLLGHSKALDVVYKFYETWDPEKALDNKCVSDVMEAKGQEKKTFILFYNGVPVFDDETFRKSNAYRDTIERALAARLKQPNDAPTSYEDYEVTYHREMLPDEVKVTEYNYNSQSV